jgi:hypothetical protein
VDRAFWLWTASAGVWWPMATHSVSGRRDSVLVIEPGAGPRLDYESHATGLDRNELGCAAGTSRTAARRAPRPDLRLSGC